MVKFLHNIFNLDSNWETVTLACFFKYPNPFSNHVLSTDTIATKIDQKTGNLHVTRLIHKTSNVPNWIKPIYSATHAFVLEESVVDLKHRTMSIVTRNISHARVAVVEERVQITASGQDDDDYKNVAIKQNTLVDTKYTVTVHFGWGIRNSIENYMSKRLKEHFAKSKLVFQAVLERLHSQPVV